MTNKHIPVNHQSSVAHELPSDLLPSEAQIELAAPPAAWVKAAACSGLVFALLILCLQWTQEEQPAPMQHSWEYKKPPKQDLHKQGVNDSALSESDAAQVANEAVTELDPDLNEPAQLEKRLSAPRSMEPLQSEEAVRSTALEQKPESKDLLAAPLMRSDERRDALSPIPPRSSPSKRLIARPPRFTPLPPAEPAIKTIERPKPNRDRDGNLFAEASTAEPNGIFLDEALFGDDQQTKPLPESPNIKELPKREPSDEERELTASRNDTKGFYGLRGKGKRYVYVVDRSSSMAPHFNKTTTELERALRGLSSNAEFYVIFYDSRTEEMPGGEFERATSETIKETISWIRKIQPGGGTDPLPGMTKAFEMEADTVWLLTDGDFDHDLSNQLKALNKDRRTVVHTIGWSQRNAPFLKAIAKDHQGQFTSF